MAKTIETNVTIIPVIVDSAKMTLEYTAAETSVHFGDVLEIDINNQFVQVFDVATYSLLADPIYNYIHTIDIKRIN